MSYYEILNEIINESNLTHKQISEECKKIGVNIDPSYISKLKTGKQPPASDEVNKAIAIACGFEVYIEDLLFESYREKAPDLIKSFLNEIVSYFRIQSKKPLKKMHPTMAAIIEESINSYTDYQLLQQSILGLKLKTEEDIVCETTITMSDKTMEPLIYKDSILVLDSDIENINNGDIIVVVIEDKYLVRRYIKIEEKVILISEDKTIEPLIIEDSNINIIGRVNHVKTNF